MFVGSRGPVPWRFAVRKVLTWSSAFVLAPAAALATLSEARSASVVFTAAGPAGLMIEGKTSELGVTEAQGNVSIVVPLANLDTGISLRNRHMREKYLEVEKYPRAELVVSRAALGLSAGGGDAHGKIPGQMTIRGRTRPVTVEYTAKSSRASISAPASPSRTTERRPEAASRDRSVLRQGPPQAAGSPTLAVGGGRRR
jgi:polyisoprenoid-binding protein YceI